MVNEANIWQPRHTLDLNANYTRVTQRFSALASQTSFTLTDFVYALSTGSLQLFKNGLALAVDIDFKELTDTTFSLVEAAAENDIILAVGYVEITGGLGSRLPIKQTTDSVTLTAGQLIVVFTLLTTENTSFFIVGPNADNGILRVTDDYSVVSSTRIDLTESYPVGTKVVAVQNSGIFGDTVDSGLTAGPAIGGQSTALELTANTNEVSTVGTVGDSVKLLAATEGLEQTVINNGANPLYVYPSSGDDLGEGLNIFASLAQGDNITYRAYDADTWIVLT